MDTEIEESADLEEEYSAINDQDQDPDDNQDDEDEAEEEGQVLAEEFEGKKVIRNPVKAIRSKCLDCSGGNRSEVKRCTLENCSLFPFRLGHNPFRKAKEISDEQREALIERMKFARRSKSSQNAGNISDKKEPEQLFLT